MKILTSIQDKIIQIIISSLLFTALSTNLYAESTFMGSVSLPDSTFASLVEAGQANKIAKSEISSSSAQILQDSKDVEIELPYRDGSVTVKLRPNNILSQKHRVVVENEIKDSDSLEPVYTFAGELSTGKATDFARLTLYFIDGKATLEGIFQVDDQVYVVEQMSVYFSDQQGAFGPGELVVAEMDDPMRSHSPTLCGTHHSHATVVSEFASANMPDISYGSSTRLIEFAADADYEFFQANGSSVSNTVNKITSIMNSVDGIYQAELTNSAGTFGVRLSEVQVKSNSNDGYSGTDPQSMLNQFSSVNTLDSDHEHLFTGRPMGGSSGGVVGIAWVGAVCFNSYNTGISQWYGNGSLSRMVPLVAHELGHNVGANHDDASPESNRIMNSILIANANNFSSLATGQILTNLESRGCITADDNPPTTFTLSGQITTNGNGLAEALVTLNPGSKTFLTGSTGNYNFASLPNGNYTVSVSKSGYTFSPTSRNVTISGANSSGQNFSASPVPQTFNVSGRVQTSSGAGLSGVSISLSPSSKSTTTNSNGYYTISNVSNGNYTVSASKSGYTFSPTNRNVTIDGANSSGQNFSASPVPQTFNVSGRVQTSSGAGLSGVSISLSPSSKSATTNSNGYYTISNVSNGNYTVSASKSGYTFSPTSRNVTIDGANSSGQNFSASPVPQTFNVSGRVKTSSGAGLSGVSISLSPGSKSTTTDSNGYYTISNVSNGTYSVSASKSQYTINPSSYSINVSGSNVNVSDFTASQNQTPSTYSVSGRVSSNGIALAGASVTLLGTNKTVQTDANGNYVLSSISDGNYWVKAEKADMVFNPSNQFVQISGADVSGINFAGTPAKQSLSLSGQVTGEDGSPVPYVRVDLKENGQFTFTNTSGNYTFSYLEQGAYTVTPSKDGYLFSPGQRTVILTNSNVTGINFSAVVQRSGDPQDPYIIQQPTIKSSGAILDGSIVTIEVKAQESQHDSSTEGLTYQWFRNGAHLSGYTTAAINLTVGTYTVGDYTVRITNSKGLSTLSAPVTLVISNGSPDVELKLKGSRFVVLGQTKVFRAKVKADRELKRGTRKNYTWYIGDRELRRNRRRIRIRRVRKSMIGQAIYYTFVDAKGTMHTSPSKVLTERKNRRR